MGIYLRANNKKCDISFDMGYGSFHNLRKKIGEYISPYYSDWLCTTEETQEEDLHRICENLYNDVGDACYSFLTQCDCDGSLTYQECKSLYERISEIDSNEAVYGYVYNRHSFNDFKILLKYCYSHRTKLVWS